MTSGEAQVPSRSISPHHQIWLLFGVAIVTLGIIVGGMLVALGPTQGQLSGLDAKLIPTIERIDTASASYRAYRRDRAAAGGRDGSSEAKRRTRVARSIALCRSVRMGCISALVGQSAGRRRAAAFVRGGPQARLGCRSPGLYGLRRLGRRVRADVGQLSDTVVADLNKIKQLYQKQLHTGSSQRLSGFWRYTTRPLCSSRQRRSSVCPSPSVLAAHAARGREIKVEVLNRTLENDSTRNELEARLQRSLEMVHSEEASYTLLNRALSRCAPGLAAELLLADSSQAHFSQVTKTAELGTGGCAVMSPAECPAARGARHRCGSVAPISIRVPTCRTARTARARRCVFR